MCWRWCCWIGWIWCKKIWMKNIWMTNSSTEWSSGWRCRRICWCISRTIENNTRFSLCWWCSCWYWLWYRCWWIEWTNCSRIDEIRLDFGDISQTCCAWHLLIRIIETTKSISIEGKIGWWHCLTMIETMRRFRTKITRWL